MNCVCIKCKKRKNMYERGHSYFYTFMLIRNSIYLRTNEDDVNDKYGVTC